jgi:hypothetical protein
VNTFGGSGGMPLFLQLVLFLFWMGERTREEESVESGRLIAPNIAPRLRCQKKNLLYFRQAERNVSYRIVVHSADIVETFIW